MENSVKGTQTFKNIWSDNPTYRYFLKDNENTNLKRNVHSTFVVALLTIAKIKKQLKNLTTPWITTQTQKKIEKKKQKNTKNLPFLT